MSGETKLPRRLFIQRLQGDFAAISALRAAASAAVALRNAPAGAVRAASDFPSDGKVTKGSPGDAADGHFVPIGPLTPGPHYGGRPPERLYVIFGAQNQECLPAF